MKQIIALTLLLFFFGCTKKDSKSKFRESLKVGVFGEIKTLDWNVASDSFSKGFLDTFVPRLLSYKLNDPKPQNNLLVSLKTQNHINWTIVVNNELIWSDGEKLTSRHLADSFNRVRDKKIASPCGGKIRQILGEEKNQGVKVINETTLALKLKFRYPDFNHELTKLCYSPIRLDLIEKYGGAWSAPKNIVSLGEFDIFDYKSGTKIILKRRNKDSKFVNKIEYFFFNSEAALINSYEVGDLDFIPITSLYDAQEYRGRKDFHMESSAMTTFLVFNTLSKPLNHKKTRNMLSRILSSSNLKPIFKGMKKKNSFFLPSSFLSKDMLKKLSIKLEQHQSKNYLSNNDSLHLSLNKSLNVLTNNSSFQLKWLQKLQYDLKNKHSIDMKINSKDWVGYLKSSKSKDFDLLRMSWFSDSLQVIDFLEIFLSNSHLNKSGWSNKEYDELVRKIVITPKRDARDLLIFEALSLLIFKEAVVVPVLEDQKIYLLKPWIKGFSNLPFHIYDFSRVYKLST